MRRTRCALRGSRGAAPAACLGLLAALALAGCAGLRVRTDYDADVDFSTYRTFEWLEPGARARRNRQAAANPFAYNSLLDKRVRKAVEQELAGRGFRKAGGGAADFRLDYHVIFEDRLVASARDWGFFPHHGGLHGGTDVEVMQLREGTLVLDVIDVARDQLTWRGWAVGRNRDGNYDEREIRRAVRSILERFPPPSRARDG